jgi:hypothetical protein
MLVAFPPLASAATAYAECARPELSGLTHRTEGGENATSSIPAQASSLQDAP